MSLENLDTARRMHREGRLKEALEIYREITDSQAAAAEHWQLRAVAEQQSGELQEARASIERAIELDPAQAAPHLVAGHIAEDLHDFERAEAGFRRALELRPDWAAAWSSLGTRLLEGARAQEAVECFQRAVSLDGKAVRAWNNLGLAQLALERFDDAIRAFNFASTLDPRYALPHLNLGRIFDVQGQTDRALASATLAAQLDPRNVEAHLLVGDMQRKRHDLDAALRAYTAAVNAAPDNAKAGNALADMLWEMGLTEEAHRVFAGVYQRHPTSLKAALGSHLLLPAVYRGLDDLEQSRERYSSGLDQLLETSERFRYPNAASALNDIRWTNFYLAYQGREDRGLQEKYGELVRRVLQASAPQWLEQRAPRARAGGRIRVGFFSYFFFNCTAGRYFASWIHGLDKERFESTVYYINPWVADDTRAIAASAGRFRHLPGRPMQVLAQQVLADDLDVLVYPELGMHADTFGLASLRLAPVQVAGWGHPATTGLPTIDWFLSSAPMEPVGAAALYSERLHTLPGLGTRYARPGGAEEGTREDYGLPEDANLYLVPQSIFKIHPDNDAVFARILARDPKARIVMFAASQALTDRFVARLEPHLRALGASVTERILLLPFVTHAAYLGLNRVCDVMLDTLHWSGGNTSLDALSMGLPIVTLPGNLMRGRQSMAMLNMVGVPELCASSVDEYVEKALAIASDRDKRAELSQRILAGLDQLFGRDEPVEAFQAFLEQAVGGAT